MALETRSSTFFYSLLYQNVNCLYSPNMEREREREKAQPQFFWGDLFSFSDCVFHQLKKDDDDSPSLPFLFFVSVASSSTLLPSWEGCPEKGKEKNDNRTTTIYVMDSGEIQ